MSQVSRVVLTIPAEPSFLRLVRMAASDAGARAGFDFEAIDDLRIGIDELCHRLLADDDAMATITLETTDGTVVATGEGSASGVNDPSEISAAIVAAVTDEHEFGDRDGRAWFRLVKRGGVPARG